MHVFADYVACKWRHSPFATLIVNKSNLPDIKQNIWPNTQRRAFRILLRSPTSSSAMAEKPRDAWFTYFVFVSRPALFAKWPPFGALG